jgi:hypothetical protein
MAIKSPGGSSSISIPQSPDAPPRGGVFNGRQAVYSVSQQQRENAYVS